MVYLRSEEMNVAQAVSLHTQIPTNRDLRYNKIFQLTFRALDNKHLF